MSSYDTQQPIYEKDDKGCQFGKVTCIYICARFIHDDMSLGELCADDVQNHLGVHQSS